MSTFPDLGDREQRIGPPGGNASNGKPYVTISFGGVKREGEYSAFSILVRVPFKYMDNRSAAVVAANKLLLDEIRTYVENAGPGDIEWRQLPTVSLCSTDQTGIASLEARARLAVVPETQFDINKPYRCKNGDRAFVAVDPTPQSDDFALVGYYEDHHGVRWAGFWSKDGKAQHGGSDRHLVNIGGEPT